uniref:Uncharacterized protein n=1 Tax=Cyprinus carpio TaxID=7962 RepID=A0A8C2BY60_CYPCA
MAEARFSQDEFQCPVCQGLLKDPVTIPCGHSYCKSCITDCWDQEDQKRVYRLAELVEKMKNTKLPADCDAGAGDVQCDVCTERKYKAVKSCLVCLESYCQNHLEQHESWFRGKRHNLTDATGRLQEMICQKHEKLLEVFCRTDQKCICMQCTIDEHKSHDTVSTAAQRTENQVFKTKLQLNYTEQRNTFSVKINISFIFIILTLSTVNNSRQLTLDLNTVNKHLRLSENNRVITNTDTAQSYSDHPDRFDHYPQVLCSESVCGRCYWELEWSGTRVFISVSYKSIIRMGRGKECRFGSNDQSWSLRCSSSRYTFRHNNVETDIPVKSISRRIGVFVDHSAETLSFYRVSDTMSLIHTVQTTFTQPLYPGNIVLFYSVSLIFLVNCSD